MCRCVCKMCMVCMVSVCVCDIHVICMPIGTYAEPRKSPQVSSITPVYHLEAGSLTEPKGLCFEQTFCPVSSPICLSFPPVLELQTSVAMSSSYHACWRAELGSSDLQAFKASTHTHWAISSKTILQISSVFVSACQLTEVFRMKFQTREIKKVIAPNLQELEEAWSKHVLSNKNKKTHGNSKKWNCVYSCTKCLL